MSQLFSLTTNGCHKQIKTDTIACGLQGQQIKKYKEIAQVQFSSVVKCLYSVGA